MEQVRRGILVTFVKADTGLSKKDERKCTSIFRSVMRIRHGFYSLASQVAGEFDLRGSEMAMIDTLGIHGPLSMNELADACFFSPPNATYTVSALEEKKLVRRERSRESHRVVKVYLTRAGERMFRKSYPTMVNRVNEMINSKLTKSEAASLSGLLQKLSD